MRLSHYSYQQITIWRHMPICVMPQKVGALQHVPLLLLLPNHVLINDVIMLTRLLLLTPTHTLPPYRSVVIIVIIIKRRNGILVFGRVARRWKSCWNFIGRLRRLGWRGGRRRGSGLLFQTLLVKSPI